jgi:hypothetical protein
MLIYSLLQQIEGATTFFRICDFTSKVADKISSSFFVNWGFFGDFSLYVHFIHGFAFFCGAVFAITCHECLICRGG